MKGARRAQSTGTLKLRLGTPSAVVSTIETPPQDHYVRILHPQRDSFWECICASSADAGGSIKPICPPRAPPSVFHLLARARQAGEYAGTFCEAMHAQQGDLAAHILWHTLVFKTRMAQL